jgi:hypothetical protein
MLCLYLSYSISLCLVSLNLNLILSVCSLHECLILIICLLDSYLRYLGNILRSNSTSNLVLGELLRNILILILRGHCVSSKFIKICVLVSIIVIEWFIFHRSHGLCYYFRRNCILASFGMSIEVLINDISWLLLLARAFSIRLYFYSCLSLYPQVPEYDVFLLLWKHF